MRWLRRILVGLVLLLVVGYAGGLAALYFLQRDFQYEPQGRLLGLADTDGLVAEPVSLPTAEDGPVTGWYAEPDPGMPVILYYKGNARSFSAEYERYKAFEAEGYGFFAFDYRGFPGSPGAISEDAILADSLAAFDWVAAKGHPVLIWGRSLGSGPATYVASEREAAALLLETPFLSAVNVAAERYWFAPVGWLMHDQFPNNTWIRRVDEPVFVAHGTGDRVIEVTNGERLYALAPNPRGIWIEPGADHGDLWERGIWERAQAFFAEAAGVKE